MSQLSRTEWEALYGTTGTVFPDNTTGEISEGDMRTFGKNASDSIPFTRNDSYTWAFPKADTSGTNTYAVTLSPAITAYTNGMKIHVKIKTASTGASTLNANTVGARKIFLDPSTQADSGDLVDEQEYIMSYDSALDAAVGGWLIIGGGGSGGGAVDSVNGQTGVVQVNADDVPFTPAGNISATDVQAAIEELDSEKYTASAATESAQGLAELATQAETNTGTDDARIVTPLKLNTKLRATRTVTGADAAVQTDDNALIILNSATPFNFTLDQITASSKITFLNIGLGAVTLIAGSGVTITGSTTISGATGSNYPSAFVFYHTATTPRVTMGGTNGLSSVSVDTTGGTITLDFNSERERIFYGSASFATPKTVALDNEDNALTFLIKFNITNVAGVLTFPSTFTMQTSDGRWDDSGHTFTPQTTGKHTFAVSLNTLTGDYEMDASNPYN